MLLYDKLKCYGGSGAYPFHMPGHKRRLGLPGEILEIDITEIDGFDNLHHAEGVLLEAQERAAALYGSEGTYFLVNGSTAGILASISACVRPGGKLLMARNSHKAAYHAAELRGLRTTYLYPDEENVVETGFSGSLSPEDVQVALEADREIEAVFITSPTYEGVVSDVRKIAGIAHSFGVPLIVDEAHGAHFGFHPYFPENSVKLGADLVIHSLHKTLPSMTQTALLHRNGTLVSKNRVQKYLGIYQSSSPSYVLMASIDACISLLEQEREELFAGLAGRLSHFSGIAGRLKHIHLLGEAGRERLRLVSESQAGKALETTGVFAKDPSKLILRADGRSGQWLQDQLRERFSLELEMATGNYAIALTSVADTDEGFQRLLTALRELDAELDAAATGDGTADVVSALFCPRQDRPNEQIMTIAQADGCAHKKIPLSESAGETSAEYIYLYPPGIPMIVPGECIGKGLPAQLEQYRTAGLSLQGLADYTARTIYVVE